MTNAEKLSLAIGEIDDFIIEEASVAYKKKIPVLKYATIAACTTLVTIGILGTLLVGIIGMIAPKSDNNAGDMAPESNESMGGSSDMENSEPGFAYGEFGSVNVTSSTYDTITLLLILTKDYSISPDLSLCSVDMSVIYTTKEDGSVLKPTITVNGITADKLPSAIGQYEITVKFDNIGSIDTEWQKYLTIDGFEPIYHGLFLD